LKPVVLELYTEITAVGPDPFVTGADPFASQLANQIRALREVEREYAAADSIARVEDSYVPAGLL
jgi:hypothetical protein